MRYRAILKNGVSLSSVRFFDAGSFEDAWTQAEEYAANAEGFGYGWRVADLFDEREQELA
jgi:hypothetical protein